MLLFLSHGPYCPLGNDSVQGVKACLTVNFLRQPQGVRTHSRCVCETVISELVGLVMQIALLNVGGAQSLTESQPEVEAAGACSLLLWCLGIISWVFLP